MAVAIDSHNGCASGDVTGCTGAVDDDLVLDGREVTLELHRSGLGKRDGCGRGGTLAVHRVNRGAKCSSPGVLEAGHNCADRDEARRGGIAALRGSW